jgi:anti-sigma factor RsiW
MSVDRDPLDGLLAERASRHAAPAALRARILRDLAAERRPRANALETTRWFTWRGLGTGFAAGALCAMLAVGVASQWSREQAMADDMMEGHVRALLTGHVFDVGSSDKHTVKPWFAGKLDYSPPVWRGADEFPLVGGRVDYLAHRAVAALIYRHRQHTISVFVWPQTQTAWRSEFDMPQGFQVIRWTAGGMQYWAVSDVNMTDLKRFRDAYQASSE